MEIRSFPRQPRETPENGPLGDIVKPPESPRSRTRKRRRLEKQSKGRLVVMRTVALAGVALIALVVIVVLGILRDKGNSGQVWQDPNASHYQIYSGARKAAEFPPPSDVEAVALVRKVLAMRKADEFRDSVRLRGMSEADAVAFLSALPEHEGKIENVAWQGSMNANGIQIEGLLVSFSKEGRKPRMALLTPDGTGAWQFDLAAFAWSGNVDWEEFYHGPAREAEVRGVVSRDAYYNGAYADEKAWACYAVSHSGSDLVMIGYCPRGGTVDEALTRMLATKEVLASRAILRLAKRGGPESRQVEILSVPAEDWILTDVPYDRGPRKEAPSPVE